MQKLLRKAASVGLDPVGDVPERAADDEAALGAALAALAASGARAGLDGESALTAWAGRFRDRFTRMERMAGEGGIDLVAADAAVVRELWERAGADIPGG